MPRLTVFWDQLNLLPNGTAPYYSRGHSAEWPPLDLHSCILPSTIEPKTRGNFAGCMEGQYLQLTLTRPPRERFGTALGWAVHLSEQAPRRAAVAEELLRIKGMQFLLVLAR